MTIQAKFNSDAIALLVTCKKYLETVEDSRAAHHRAVLINKMSNQPKPLASMSEAELGRFDDEMYQHLCFLDN